MKKFMIGILVLILLLVAAALAAPFVIPADIYKAKLIAAVKESTGRDLKIDGPISFSLLPQIALSAQDVSFANAPGGIAQDMVQLKSMALKLKLLPLLTGTVEIDSLVLVEPAIALEIDKQGRPNWDFSKTETPEGAPATASETGGKSGGLSALSSLRLGEIQLQNGEVSYADQRSEKRWDANAINVTLSMTDLDSPLAAQGSAMWNGEQVNLAVAIAKPGAFAGGTPTDISVKLVSNPFNLDFAGSGAGGPEMKLSGVVDLAVPSVREFAKWAGTPITMAGSGLGPLSIKGKVEVAGDSYDFSDAEIALDAIKATGAVSVDTSHAKPYAKGDLEVETLDLNPYLAPESAPPQTGAAPSAGVEGRGAGRRRLDAEGLEHRADGSLGPEARRRRFRFERASDPLSPDRDRQERARDPPQGRRAGHRSLRSRALPGQGPGRGDDRRLGRESRYCGEFRAEGIRRAAAAARRRQCQPAFRHRQPGHERHRPRQKPERHRLVAGRQGIARDRQGRLEGRRHGGDGQERGLEPGRRLQPDRFLDADRDLHHHQRHPQEQRPENGFARAADARRRHRRPAAAAGRLQAHAQDRGRARLAGEHHGALGRSFLPSRSEGRGDAERQVAAEHAQEPVRSRPAQKPARRQEAAVAAAGRLSARLARADVEADRHAADLHRAGILEQPEFLDARDPLEAGLAQIRVEDVPIEADVMEVVRIELAAEHHAHHLETIFRRQLRMDEQAAQRIEIGQADNT